MLLPWALIYLLCSLPLLNALQVHPKQQVQLQEHLNLSSTSYLHVLPVRKGVLNSPDGALWQDSLGGFVQKIPNRGTGKKKYTSNLVIGTILYHTDKRGTENWKMRDSSLFLSPDILASVMTQECDDNKIETEPTVHIFKVTKDIPDLVYWYKKYYPVWFNGNHLEKTDFQGCETDEHQELVNLVCNGKVNTPQKAMNGWRAPYDQDEVMLCKPTDWLQEIKSYGLKAFYTEFDRLGYKWEKSNGVPPCKEPCMYAYVTYKLQDTKKVYNRDEVIALLNRLFLNKPEAMINGTDIYGANLVTPVN